MKVKKYKSKQSHLKLHTLSQTIYSVPLFSYMSSITSTTLAGRLPDSFKVPLEENLLKHFEYEFLSADFHLLNAVITALSTITGHLLKELDEENKIYGDLTQIKALEFMLKVYKDLTKEIDVLKEIGVLNSSNSQLHCLANLPLTATYSCLKMFTHWVDEGFYDFNTIPFSFKVHLRDEDKLVIKQLPHKWAGTLTDLKKQLQQFIEVLKGCEEDIITAEAVNVCLLLIQSVAVVRC